MTKKYLILPQNGGDKFRQLLASMPGTAQEQFMGNPHANL